MFPPHLTATPEQWMSIYAEAAAPMAKAMEDAFTSTAAAFMPPPWNMMMRAAFAWRDLANAGYASSPRSPRGLVGRSAPPAPVGIAASPAASTAASTAASATAIAPFSAQPMAWSQGAGYSSKGPDPKMPPTADPKSSDKSSVVLINTFVVPVAMEEAFLGWWRMLKPAFAAQPGFIRANLHRSLDQNERYRFINIAEWESSEAYQRALSSLWSVAPKPTIAGLEWHPALYEIVEQA